MMQEKGENKMPKGKGTYGKQVGRPPEDGSKRSVKTYAGGGVTGYNVPQPTWDQGSVARQFRMEEGGKVKSVSEKNKEKREAIKKGSVNKETEPILEKINKTGKFNYQCGGKVPHYDARKRRK